MAAKSKKKNWQKADKEKKRPNKVFLGEEIFVWVTLQSVFCY